MIFVKRVSLLVFLILLLILALSSRNRNYRPTLQSLSQKVGLGEYIYDEEDGYTTNPVHDPNYPSYESDTAALIGSSNGTSSKYPVGTIKGPGERYTRAVVMGRLAANNTDWLDEAKIPDLQQFIYVVDDKSAALHTELNKGNEAMVYLTYILDNYDSLPDISIFMHAHRVAWHTPELLNHDIIEVLKRLSSERVTREGYVNLRCHWDPGCPERIHPGAAFRDRLKAEEVAIAEAWSIMFPGEPIPDALGAPCCAQFAVSRQRIQSIPKKNFERYRKWLVDTKEISWVSGRVFEYLWQKIFVGEAKVCPDARICYCDGYGICFESDFEYERWFSTQFQRREKLKEIEQWERLSEELEEMRRLDGDLEMQDIMVPQAWMNERLQTEYDALMLELNIGRDRAMQLGTSPKFRAEVAGRPWKEGDGY